jgi:hypothetical protein
MEHTHARIYQPNERPDVEVLVEGDWQEGQLRSWSLAPDGAWWANVQHRAGPGKGTHLGTFHQDDVREDTVDRSNGRDG